MPADLQAQLGKANLTKALKAGNERDAGREAIPHIAKFQALIDGTREWGQIHEEAKLLTGMSLDGLLHSPTARRWFALLDQKADEIYGVPAVRQSPEPVPFATMIRKWGRGKSQPAIDSMEAKCRRFIDYLGHDDMARVGFTDCRDWLDEMIEDGDLAPGTIANRIKLVKALFTVKANNDPDPDAANPWARVKYSPGDGEERDDFTHEERRLILLTAREQAPHIYWLNWICSFHGCRTGEVADMSTLDIEQVDGIWIFNITTRNRSKDQRLKTAVSKRRLAFHQAVIDEGFIEFRDQVVAQHGHGPLFRDVKPDHYGRRAGTVTKDLRDWLRNEVGIKDPRKVF